MFCHPCRLIRIASRVCELSKSDCSGWGHFVLQGTLTYPAPTKKDEEEEDKPGDKFEGNLNHGQREGKGKYTWSNGCYYDGEYKNHMRHGNGTLTLPDKGRYEGWCGVQQSFSPSSPNC